MASVVVSIVSSSANVNLTSLGGADYAIYNGNTALTTFERKSGGGSTISVADYDPDSSYFLDSESKSRIYSASDATPTSSVSSGNNARNVSFGSDKACGFITTFPASTDERTVKIYVMAYNNNGSDGNVVEAVCTLGDSSASDTETFNITAGVDNFLVVEVTYSASSTTTLSVRFNLQATTSSNVRATHWGAAWVSSPAASGSTGTVATTNANDTSSASGTTTITGTSTTTNASDTSTASGTTTVTGTSTTTNANDTSTATGSPVIVGTSATTNANDTSAASGSPVVAGTSATTNADDTATAAGSVGSAVSGTSTTTNANDTSAAAGTTTIVGTSSTANANDTSTAVGTVGDPSIGTSATTNANDTSTASGTTTVTGTSATTNADDTAAAIGAPAALGTSATTNANDTINAVGTAGSAGKSGVNRERLSVLTQNLNKKPAKTVKAEAEKAPALVIKQNTDGSVEVQEELEQLPEIPMQEVFAAQEEPQTVENIQIAPNSVNNSVLDSKTLDNLLLQSQNDIGAAFENAKLAQQAAMQKAMQLQQEEDDMLIQYAIEVLL